MSFQKDARLEEEARREIPAIDERLLKLEDSEIDLADDYEYLKTESESQSLILITLKAEIAYLRGYTQSLAEEISRLSMKIALITSTLHIN